MYMNYQDSEPIVTERKNYLSILLVILGLVVVLAALYLGYLQYQDKQLKKAALLTEGKILSEGLDTPIGTTPMPSGVIYFGATVATTTSVEPRVYSYNIVNNTISTLSEDIQTEVIPMGTSTRLAILSKDQYGATDSFQPYRLNLLTQEWQQLPNLAGHRVTDLTVSPDGTKYAFSYQDLANVDSETPQLLPKWNIAVYTFGADTPTIIQSGRRPQWLNNGTELLYLSEQGIMQYTIDSQVSKLVFEKYQPFTSFDDIAVSPDSQRVIMTKPSENLISVLSFSQDNARSGRLLEIGRLVSEDTTYTNPTFAPDSKYYVTTANKIKNFAMSIDAGQVNYTYDNEYFLQTRYSDNAEVIQSIPLPNVSADGVIISNWSSQ
jgi:hypothetical protein